MPTAGQPPRRRNLAFPFLSLFLLLIIGGVLIKRLAGHPEFVIFFHLPAAVFLVLGGLELKKRRQSQYEEEIALVRREVDPPHQNQNQADP